eukprot:13232999-Alexandrium_andersonii.AAC.1
MSLAKETRRSNGCSRSTRPLPTTRLPSACSTMTGRRRPGRCLTAERHAARRGGLWPARDAPCARDVEG